MANRIGIDISAQPNVFDTLYFYISRAGFTYPIANYNLLYISGIPTTANQVQIGVDLATTRANTLAAFIAVNTYANINFTLEPVTGGDDCIFLNFTPIAVYTITPYAAPSGFRLFEETITVIPPITLLPFDVNTFSIQIFDTYDNQRILIEELTQVASPKLVWDSGDTLFNELMPSKLTFNLLAAGSKDAVFKHLLTGDEQRYLVKLIAIDTALVETLVWQGFLLPDVYKEPWTNAAVFVEFTATDMLGALKGKTLQPWFYPNRFPIGQLLAYVLVQTGLKQNILVNPSLLPADAGYDFTSLNIPLNEYYDGKKYDDIYTILQDVLKCNALTISSFRGYWIISGVTTRKDTTCTFYQFDLDGSRVADVLFDRSVITPYFNEGTPILTAVTPYKTIDVTFDLKGSNNLFSDNVVAVADFFTTEYKNNEHFLLDNENIGPERSFRNKDVADWVKVGFLSWLIRKNNVEKVQYSKYYVTYPVYVALTESEALVNYFQSPDSVYLRNDVTYKLVLEFQCNNMQAVGYNGINLTGAMNAGWFDMLFPFQIIQNGVEILSNRPSFPGHEKLRFTATNNYNIQDHILDLTFRLEYEFKVDVDGVSIFRVLHPVGIIGDHIPDLGLIVYDFGDLSLEKLKVEVVDFSTAENVVAVRPINYTQKLPYDCKLVSTPDLSVRNNIGLGAPIDPVYIKEIDTTVNPDTFYGNHQFLPATNLLLTLHTWQLMLAQTYNDLFIDGKSEAVFIEKTTGEYEMFKSLWCQKNAFPTATNKMGFLTDYDGHPDLPKNYVTHALLATTDKMKYMVVRYGAEDLSKRENWKIAGSSNIRFFNKTLATALHGVHPEALYRLEATALELLFPHDLIEFYYDFSVRNFIPTTLTLDLSSGKTSFIATEAKFEELTDIVYE